MNSFSRILVALDNSPMDQYLIRHARRVADLFEASRVYFVFILPSLALPKSAQAAFREQFEPDVPIDEQVRAALEKEILENWGAERATEWSLDVIEGKPFSQLLHWLDVKKIELLVVGQKLASTGSGITARKLASHARCNVLFVPEMPLNDGMRLLAPVDFSKDSARALKMALTWKSTHPAAGIVALHVTDLLATGYYLNRQEFENFNRFLSETAQESFRKFLEEHQLPAESMEIVILRNDDGSISDRINAYALESGFDWILVGAQGHGAIERFFFGSVTEKLVSKPLPAPTLVVR